MINVFDVVAWSTSTFLLIRCICVLSRISARTWKRTPYLNVAVISLAIASLASVVGPFYGKEIVAAGHSIMLICVAVICAIDDRRTWSARQRRKSHGPWKT